MPITRRGNGDKGATIRPSLGSAVPGPTTVPDVVGMSRRDALDAIRAADLVANIAPSGSGRHEIISQAPTAGQVVGQWTTVDLVAERVS
jgi:beta-lactam-binding protein with PASTA domain